MKNVRDWQQSREMWRRVLKERTGEDMDTWNRRIELEGFSNEQSLIQARKTYISLVTPRRTFARVQPTTKNRVDLGLRLEGRKPGGRLQPSTIHQTMKLQISLTSVDQVDVEVLSWLLQAYDENC